MNYAVLTPLRDEATELPRLARCLAAQLVRPVRWILIDNGSSDGTHEIASELARRYDWVRVLTVPPGPPRMRGGNVVRAMHAGIAQLEHGVDLVAKVDADVSFGADYFERLVRAFDADAALGMASGACVERTEGVWRERPVTGTHVWGAARAYRAACLRDVLPLDERMGWDGIDQIRAATRGWKVDRVPGLQFRHHRREGERDGSRLRVWAAQGSAAHYMGYRFSYLLLRTLHRARREPAAAAILGAYLLAWMRREQRCPDAEVRKRLRREQRARHLLVRARELRAREAVPRSG